MSNYAIKSDLKTATGVDILRLAKKDYSANLKLEVDKLDIDKLEKLDVDKLSSVVTDLRKLILNMIN